jgi:hypothetical protein
MRTTYIILSIVLAIGLILFGIMNYAGNKITEEIDRELRPKFNAMGADYESIEAHPAKGALTFHGLTYEQNEVDELTITSKFEDLVAFAQGNAKELHGLDIQLSGGTLGDGAETIEMGDAHISFDALIDLELLQSNPNQYLTNLLLQDDLYFVFEGQDLFLKMGDLQRALGRKTNGGIRLDSWSGSLSKEGEALEVSWDMESPDLGDLAVTLSGTNNTLEHLELEASSYTWSAFEGLQLSVDDMSMDFDGSVSFEKLMEGGWEDSILDQGATSWNFSVDGLEAEGAELMSAGLPSSTFLVKELKHSMDFDANRLKSEMNLASNLGDLAFQVDLDIESMDPPIMEATTFEVTLSDLHPTLSGMASMIPLPFQPDGPHGLTLSYTGPLDELGAAY